MAVAVGIKATSDQTGVSYDAIRQRSSREGWMNSIPRDQPLPPSIQQPVTGVTKPAVAMGNALASLGDKSRIAVAKGLYRGSKTISKLKGEVVLNQAQQITAHVKSLSAVHGWNQQKDAPSLVQIHIAPAAPVEKPAGVVIDMDNL